MTDKFNAVELLDEDLNEVAGGVNILGESCWEAICEKNSAHIINWRGDHVEGEKGDCPVPGCGGQVVAKRQLY